jgi:hypothetical protein
MALMLALAAVAIGVVVLFEQRVGASVVLAMAVALAVVPIASLVIYFRCPKCSASLGSLVGHFGPVRRLGKQVTHCPFCGVQLDSSVAP